MGLDVCADTIVGDSMVRGCSGGQRKRVTTAEHVVGPKKTIFADEISTGTAKKLPMNEMQTLTTFLLS